MSDTHDITFHSMGSDVRLLIGPPLLAHGALARPRPLGVSGPTSRTSRRASRAFAPRAS